MLTSPESLTCKSHPQSIISDRNHKDLDPVKDGKSVNIDTTNAMPEKSMETKKGDEEEKEPAAAAAET